MLAPGTEDPTHTGCHLREATSTFPALAKIEGKHIRGKNSSPRRSGKARDGRHPTIVFASGDGTPIIAAGMTTTDAPYQTKWVSFYFFYF